MNLSPLTKAAGWMKTMRITSAKMTSKIKKIGTKAKTKKEAKARKKMANLST